MKMIVEFLSCFFNSNNHPKFLKSYGYYCLVLTTIIFFGKVLLFLVYHLKLFIMVNAQEWLDREYPKEERSKVEELVITGKGLEGELELKRLKKLERLNCSCNELENLVLKEFTDLKILSCSDKNIIIRNGKK